MKITQRSAGKTTPSITLTCLLVATLGVIQVSEAGNKEAAAEPESKLTAEGQKLEKCIIPSAPLEMQYAEQLKALQAQIAPALPKVSEEKLESLRKTGEALQTAEKQAKAAGEAAGKSAQAIGGIGIWKKYSLPDATKKIAEAQEQLKTATTDAERIAAQKTLEAQGKRLASLNANLKAAEEESAKSKSAQGKDAQEKLNQAKLAAQAALAQAQTNELNAAKAILADMEPLLASDKLDAKLIKAALLASATPQGLAGFAQLGQAQAALVEKLLADPALMKQMLEAGGAKFSQYGRAMEIYTAIQQVSPKAKEGVLQRLALATSLEHAKPIAQGNAQDEINAPATVDPVKRYLHYEKAYLAGELDPAFKDFSVWEYRMVVNCNAPDQILAWGREALRNYRPDHVTNPDYGWRYAAAVTTEVPYGSQCVKDDLSSLNPYQNIPKDGGICGRRAFFGRFILQSFGIPVWGVTQDAHAALSHWTPKGWVVNLGAGYSHSWWDKDEAPRSGLDFQLESQARAHGRDYMKVLRAQWVSAVLGEQAYNDRKKVAGGIWSRMAHYQAAAIATTAVALGPLGQELAEANAPEKKASTAQTPVKAVDQQVVVGKDGALTIPAVLHGQASGASMALKSFSGGMQLNCNGGFKTQYAFEAAQAGKYALTARVATLQEGQKFLFAANAATTPLELAVPYTIGMWQQTQPLEVTLVKGPNVLNFESKPGSRGVAIKEFTLTPVK